MLSGRDEAGAGRWRAIILGRARAGRGAPNPGVLANRFDGSKDRGWVCYDNGCALRCFVPQGWKMDLVEIADPVEQYEAMTAVKAAMPARGTRCG